MMSPMKVQILRMKVVRNLLLEEHRLADFHFLKENLKIKVKVQKILISLRSYKQRANLKNHLTLLSAKEANNKQRKRRLKSLKAILHQATYPRKKII